MNMLKKALRDKHKPLKLIAIANMFKLLDIFGQMKAPAAPALYKALIFAIVENPSDSTIRELFFTNFVHLFDSQPGIPPNLLVEPLLKQI